jgi:hypothetical protein
VFFFVKTVARKETRKQGGKTQARNLEFPRGRKQLDGKHDKP